MSDDSMTGEAGRAELAVCPRCHAQLPATEADIRAGRICICPVCGMEVTAADLR